MTFGGGRPACICKEEMARLSSAFLQCILLGRKSVVGWVVDCWSVCSTATASLHIAEACRCKELHVSVNVVVEGLVFCLMSPFPSL